MINVQEIVTDPDFGQGFTILRSTGSYLNGIFQSSTVTLQAYGTITPAEPRDLKEIPEADIVTGAMVFHSPVPIFATRSNPQGGQGASDILSWRGFQWRVLKIGEYLDWGFWRAIATRLSTT